MDACTGVVPRYLVRNTNGGILGGFMSLHDAKRCRDVWKDRYGRQGLAGDVGVRIHMIGVDNMHVYTEEQWNSFPKNKRGRVDRDASFEYGKNRGFGIRPVTVRPNSPLVGRRTLYLCNRMLIECIDFKIYESLL